MTLIRCTDAIILFISIFAAFTVFNGIRFSRQLKTDEFTCTHDENKLFITSLFFPLKVTNMQLLIANQSPLTD